MFLTSRLIDALPDLVLELTRDGVISAYMGGHEVPVLKPVGDAATRTLESIWPAGAAAALKQSARKAIASRTALETRFADGAQEYAARVFPRGPDRALCVIRAEPPRGAPDDPAAVRGGLLEPRRDRRGFLHNFYSTVAQCLISEKPAAVAVLHLEGVGAISRGVDPSVADEVVTAAILRLPSAEGSLGQLNKSTLAVLMETDGRSAIEGLLTAICASLRQPVTLGGSVFHLMPFAGVAILGRDADSGKELLDHARVAATEARRSKAREPHFFSDTIRLRSLARLDITLELREAIDGGGIQSRYVGRHDLARGGLVALVAYARWRHPLRGDIPPKDFLGLAESTGSAIDLSRGMLRLLGEDFLRLEPDLPPQVRMSYGPLRHHLLHEEFIADVDAFLARGHVPPARLEVRIAERTFIVLHPSVCAKLAERGIQVVVDEMGRGMGSLDRLARAPLWGLQLDRPWVESLRDDAVALKVCRAGISAASALGLVPIVTGVDSEEQRLRLIELGCTYGSGDVFPAFGVEQRAAVRCA